ncbi:MAG: hypothetical protein II825_08960 [Paludibacteraceae bacterium]|nr:hypothetical protein [Paludibacteraceae bacterium]
MKKTVFLFLAMLMACAAIQAKPLIVYKTIVYTDSTLTSDLGTEVLPIEDGSRGFGSGLLNALGNAALGVATGYISSVVDLGIQAIGQLITMDRRHKQEWMENATKECSYSSSMGTLYAINDFYSCGSDLGALDPSGIQFNGIGCLATVAEDTSFYVSCHLDRQKLHRIKDHSKFELVLDTVVINPYHCHLPNSALPIPFSFADRKTFNFKMTIQIKSSWMDFTPGLHKDELLGEFVLDIPIDSTDINRNGSFVYVRKAGQRPKYELMGESFIVPRSYIQIPDQANGLRDHFGTGQYSLSVMVEESCELTQTYKDSWRSDRKYRKSLAKGNGKKKSFDEVWKTITHQTWDESLQAWVVTILKAPADYSIKTMNEELRLK